MPWVEFNHHHDFCIPSNTSWIVRRIGVISRKIWKNRINCQILDCVKTNDTRTIYSVIKGVDRQHVLSHEARQCYSNNTRMLDFLCALCIIVNRNVSYNHYFEAWFSSNHIIVAFTLCSCWHCVDCLERFTKVLALYFHSGSLIKRGLGNLDCCYRRIFSTKYHW